MATLLLFPFRPPRTFATSGARRSNIFRCLMLLIGLPLFSISTRAQLQQPFVFAADPSNSKNIDVYTRNDLTGVLTPVAGSPFPSKESVNVMAIDFKGRFLFTASDNPSTISMFAVDPNTGALQEVANSPFASPATNLPVFLSTESSGQFLYVINYGGSQPGGSSFESFQIDAAAPGLIPSPNGPTQLPGLFMDAATHPSGKSFYALLNMPNAVVPNEAVFLLFDSSNGTFITPSLPLNPFTNGTMGCCFGLDPKGMRLALALSDLLFVYTLQPDGTLLPNSSPDTSPFNGAPFSMSFDPLGQFLYVDILNSAIGPTHLVHFFPVSTLLESANSPLVSGFPFPATWNVDPSGPLIYADQVYQVDPGTGIPTLFLSVNPIGPAGPGIPHAIFSQPPGSQSIVGPIAQLSSTSLSFGNLNVGQTSSAQTLIITSTGGQALSLNTLGITGLNPGDFAESDTCHVPTVLQPNNSCSVLITFAPSATGSRSAALTISDNASPSTESAQLSGTGLAPAPAVALVPGTLDFGTTTVGTSTPMNITVTNTGTAALHIVSVTLSGANTGDFAFSDPTCNVPIPVNGTCTITFTFTPLAAGLRSANVTLTDDAPDSPQFLSLKGSANATPTSAVLINPSSLDFGTTTQGTSTAMNISVKNAGTASLHITNVVLGGTNVNEFSFSDPTCGGAIPAGGTCTIAMTFAPLATGARVASISLTDDAPDSPQIISVRGVSNPAFTAGPAPGSSTTASVSAGQTAQFQLQLAPGPGFTGTVALTCSGAPLNATCQVPANVSIAGSVTSPFTVSVSTSGPAIFPPSVPRRFVPMVGVPVLLLLAFVVVLVVASKHRRMFAGAITAKRLAWSGAVTAVIFFSMIYAAGCGSAVGPVSASPTPVPPPAVTPSGTFTIVITPAAVSSTGQPLQLAPIQLTLTVE